MKTKIVTAAAAAAVLGAVVAFATPTLANGTSGQGYQGHGMMGGGHGMMGGGHGMMGGGHGMMGQGMMGQGMMGRGGHHGQQGMGYRGAKGGCSANTQTRDRDLSVDDVKKIIEGRLARRGNDRLKVGKVEAKDEKTIIAEILTVDDSLVDRIEFDRKTGTHKRAK